MLKGIIVEFMGWHFDQDEFIFPILNKSENPEDYTRYILFRRQNLNKRFEEIAEYLVLNLSQFIRLDIFM